LYNFAATTIASSQKQRGSFAQFNNVLAQLFNVWFKRSALPFCSCAPASEWINFIPFS